MLPCAYRELAREHGYLKPPLFVRLLFNSMAGQFAIGAETWRWPGGATVDCTRSRSSRSTHADARYVVSTRGESERVRNPRAVVGEIRAGGEIVDTLVDGPPPTQYPIA